MIAEDDDVRLGAEGKEVLILFDGQDTHVSDCFWGTIFSHGTILAEDEPGECTHTFNVLLLFVVALQPYFTVRMG